MLAVSAINKSFRKVLPWPTNKQTEKENTSYVTIMNSPSIQGLLRSVSDGELEIRPSGQTSEISY